jgi:hypothetical protein
MEFTVYYEKIDHGLELTQIIFSEKYIMIIDSTDHFDDDSEWEEYYTIEPNNFLKLISRLEKNYESFLVENLSFETKSYFESIETSDIKKIFLLFLSLIGYDKNIKHKNEKYIRGNDLIKIFCGDDIKYKRDIYSKGP